MPRTDAASRVIAAPVSEVFAALVEPDALLRWLPPGDMTASFERFDMRPGGSYRMVLRYPEKSGDAGKVGDGTDVVEARIVDLVPEVAVLQAVDFVSDDAAFHGTMKMTWRLSEIAEGTRVDFVADDVPDGISSEAHAEGMSSSLANLARFLEDRR